MRKQIGAVIAGIVSAAIILGAIYLLLPGTVGIEHFMSEYPALTGILGTLLAIICFVTVYLLFTQGLPITLGKAEVIAYCVLLAASMFIPQGKKGLNLNPSSFFEVLASHSGILNLIVFIPIGMFFYKHYTSSVLAHLITVGAIIIKEFLQYLFGIGVGDINDVLFDYVGILIGVLLCFIIKKFCHIQSNQNKYILARS